METQVATMARENSGTSPKLRTYAGIRGVTIMRELRENGGATIDLSSDDLSLAKHTTGFYVGGAQGLKALTAPLAAVDTRHVQYALKAISEALGGSGYFGVWHDGHTFYADGSQWFESFEAARQVARERGEIAIYDIANQRDLFIDEDSNG